jgi:hypothetical protein
MNCLKIACEILNISVGPYNIQIKPENYSTMQDTSTKIILDLKLIKFLSVYLFFYIFISNDSHSMLQTIFMFFFLKKRKTSPYTYFYYYFCSVYKNKIRVHQRNRNRRIRRGSMYVEETKLAHMYEYFNV